jgi:hypothetical protein
MMSERAREDPLTSFTASTLRRRENYKIIRAFNCNFKHTVDITPKVDKVLLLAVIEHSSIICNGMEIL